MEYLNDLRQNLEIASSYATEHGNREQQLCISRYNVRAREKSFAVGEQVLILIPDSTSSKVFSRWLGPANVVEKRSPHSYIVEYNGVSRHLHADKLRKYHVSVQEFLLGHFKVTLKLMRPRLNSCVCQGHAGHKLLG